jgi:putative SOS response-associated peptidase YedK
MTFAGLWEEWQPPAGQPLRSCTIITTDSNKLVAEVHDRMPVIIGPKNWAAWLGEEPSEPTGLLKPFPPERMTLWPVSKRVGNVKNNDPALTDPVTVGSS